MQFTSDTLLMLYSTLTTFMVGGTFLFLWTRLRRPRLLSFSASFLLLSVLLAQNAYGMQFGWHPYRFQVGGACVLLSLAFLVAGCRAHNGLKAPYPQFVLAAVIAWLVTESIALMYGIPSIAYVPIAIGIFDLYCAWLFFVRRRGSSGILLGSLFIVRGALHLPWFWIVFTPYGNIVRSADQVLLIAFGMALVVAELFRARAKLAQANATLARQTEELQVANERLNVERQLAVSASNAKSAFLANMSHELRTPLNAIMGFSEILSIGAQKNTDSRQADYGKDIHRAARALLDFVEQILELSRLDANRVDFNSATVDVGDLVDRAIAAAKKRHGTSPADIVKLMKEGTGSVEGDERLLRQALTGIISRALRFSGEDGAVRVLAGPEPDEQVRIEVTDNGPALSKEEMDESFNPFNLDNAIVTPKGGGIDLSLPLAKRYIEVHGGAVSIDTGSGAGTTILIDLPRRPHLH